MSETAGVPDLVGELEHDIDVGGDGRGKITQKVAEARSSTPEELKRLLGGDASAAQQLNIAAPKVSIGGPPPAGNGNGSNGGGVSIGGPGRGI